MLPTPLLTVTRGGACEPGPANQSSHSLPHGIAPEWAKVPGPMVRTFPEVSELWVEVLGSGVDLLGPSSPPREEGYLQEGRD